MSLPGPFSVVQGQLNELQATSPCTGIADNLDVGREEERVEASGHGRKAFLEWHTLVCTLGWANTALLLMFHCPR